MNNADIPDVYYHGSLVSPEAALRALRTIHLQGQVEDARDIFTHAMVPGGDEARDLLLEYGLEFIFR